MFNTKIMQYHTKVILAIVLLTSQAGTSEGTDKFGKTIEMLNKGFKTFVISRENTNKKEITALVYMFPPQGLESDSKQNLIGVTFFIAENGDIVSIKPDVAKHILPDQKEVSIAINSGVSFSEFLAKNGLEDLRGIQAYGLLTKWAVAVLARNDGVRLKFNMDDKLRDNINKLFKGEINIPLVPACGARTDDMEIERFAKDVIRYSPY